ncbi:MAG: hypothetical protein HY678_11980, partial [Chloroflexi bacterium]|nr:hypothetical protein [Chloroflexota bacterium]
TDWRYADWTAVPWLRTRESYVQHVAGIRVERIKKEIAAVRPPVVMMYGLAGFAYERWRRIAGVSMSLVNGLGGRLEIGTGAGTIYVISPHPAARGITAGFFTEVGRLLQGRLGGIEA